MIGTQINFRKIQSKLLNVDRGNVSASEKECICYVLVIEQGLCKLKNN